jgi:hypothetical protein
MGRFVDLFLPKDCQIKITFCSATFTITVWSVCLPSPSDRFLAQEVRTSNKKFEMNNKEKSLLCGCFIVVKLAQ